MAFNLEKGMNIQITNKSKPDFSYSSKILEMKEDELLILGPMKEGRYVFIPREVILYVSYKSPQYGNVYFDCLVEERILDNGYILRVARITDFQSHQNRNYFRVEISLQSKLYYTDDSGEQFEDTETLDLSASGVRVYSNTFFNPGKILEFEMKLGSEIIRVDAKVIRQIDTNSVRFKYQYGLSFVNADESIEDRIIKYLFDYQRLLSMDGRYD